MENLEVLKDCELKYVEVKGAVHAELYGRDGKMFFKDDKWFTNSMKPLTDFTRDTKRVIRVYGPDGDMVQEMAEGTLAPYWDAAQAAKKTACGEKELEALKNCVKALGQIKAPVDLLEEVTIPARAVSNTLRGVIAALETAQEEQKS